jgi:CheY-like chemotaxis protein
MVRSQTNTPPVLLAEDNAINAELIIIMAQKLGVAVAHATNGNDAVEMVEHASAEGRPFALILMDVMMPELDGVGAALAIRKAGHGPNTLPIIAVTAAATADEAQIYIAAGMQGCIAKPVSKSDLSSAFQTWLPSPSPLAHNAEERMKSSLWLRYEQRKAETIQRLDAAIADQDFRQETVAEVRNLLHKLAGTAGSFGEAQLSQAATFCETALINASADGIPEIMRSNRKRLIQAC